MMKSPAICFPYSKTTNYFSPILALCIICPLLKFSLCGPSLLLQYIVTTTLLLLLLLLPILQIYSYSSCICLEEMFYTVQALPVTFLCSVTKYLRKGYYACKDLLCTYGLRM